LGEIEGLTRTRIKTQTEARKHELLGQERRTLSREEAGADSSIGSFEGSTTEADLSIGLSKKATGSSEASAEEAVGSSKTAVGSSKAMVGPSEVP